MKKLSALLLLLSHVFYAQAQLDSARKACHDHLLNQLFAAQAASSAPGAKTTGAAERLTSMNVYQDTNATGTWIRTDSARFTYSGIHGSVFSIDDMGYDLFPNLTVYKPITISFIGSRANILYDSFYNYHYIPGSVRTSIYRIEYTDDQPTDLFSYTVGDTTALDNRYRYNTVGKLISIRRLTVTKHLSNYWWDADYYAYNAKNQIIEDSSVFSNLADTNSSTTPEEKWDYTYNIIGDPTDIYASYFVGSWYPNFHNIYIYAAAHKIGVIRGYDPGPDLIQIDSFSYSSGVPYYTFHSDTTFDGFTGLYTFQESDQKYTDASGRVDSMIYQEPNYKEVHYYNYTSLGNPLTDSVVILHADTLSAMKVAHYFYKPVPLGLQPINVTASDIQVYPNPAAGLLYIHSSAINTPVSLTLYNAQGQLAATTTLTMATGYSHFDIGHLTPGIYFLTLTDEKGAVLKKKTIVKQ